MANKEDQDYDEEEDLDTEYDEEDDDEDLEEEEEDNLEDVEMAQEEEQQLEPEKKEKEFPVEKPSAPEEATPPERLPLHVIVEVGRLSMTVKELLELQPGNILNLDLSPEDGVNLVVGDKRVGKGELIKVGDTLGVRILDLGK